MRTHKDILRLLARTGTTLAVVVLAAGNRASLQKPVGADQVTRPAQDSKDAPDATTAKNRISVAPSEANEGSPDVARKSEREDKGWTRAFDITKTVEDSIGDKNPASPIVIDAAFQSPNDVADLMAGGAPPVADAGGPYLAPLTSYATFDGSGSVSADPDNVDIVSYEWDFGDDEFGFGQPAYHIYDKPGIYKVTLTVTDAVGMTDTAAATVEVEPMVVCVPWQFDPDSGSEIRHDLWNGLSTRLKAVVFTDRPTNELTYTWEFGDGSEPQMGTVSDKRVIEATHTYSGSQNQLITATLTVHDPDHDDLTDTYPMIIRARDLQVEVNVAIDEALWYLHKVQEANGTWASFPNFWAGSTASAIHAMEIHGHKSVRSVAIDPLVEDVVRGLTAMLTYLTPIDIDMQEHGDPDDNGNGIGIGVDSTRPVYESGMVMDALAASNAPDMIADSGPNGVIGRRYLDITQDMIDMFSWGQRDVGSNRGGWRYEWQEDADNSACQWAAIGALGAREKFGLDAPDWVKEQNEEWLAFSRQTDGSGRFGYTASGHGGCDSYRATTPSA